MISRDTIDRVFEASRVEEVIGDFVNLKKAGSNFKGLSPFTDERTPSFMVSPAKQIWKDFSSGKGGNVVSFLMEHEHFSYPETIKYLAKKYGIEIEEIQQTDEEKEKASERESLYLVNEYAQKYFYHTLLDTERGKAIGLSYFKERGFNAKTIKTFGLGYSLDEWSAFTEEATNQGYQLEFLEKTGLTILKGEKKIDRFKGRVMFPILSMSGRVLGFGGRILTNNKKTAKYLNSPESDIYQKSKVLYGLYQARKSIAREDNCFLVEGYTDVIQLHQKGVQNVVASSGTALTPDQIRLVKRLTNNITVLFDGDEAGINASLRGIDLILEQDMNVKVCLFSEGEDPDSFAKSHTEAEIKNYLTERAVDFIQFKVQLLLNQSKNDPIKKAETVREIIQSISMIVDPIKRDIYVKECSTLMEIDERVIFSSLAQIIKKRNQELNRQHKKEQKAFEVVKRSIEKVDVQYELERKIIEILLLYGDKESEFEDLILKEENDGELVLEPILVKSKVYRKIYLDLQEDEMEFTNASFKKIYHQIIAHHQQEKQWSVKNFIRTIAPDIADEISGILMQDENYKLHNWSKKEIYPKAKEDSISQLVTETILNLRCFLISKKIDELCEQTQEQLEVQHVEILEEIINYKKLDNLLSRKLQKPM